jgi:dihydrofolate reductase
VRQALPLVLVAAVARNRVIGGGNRLLWHIPSDLRRFKTKTLGKPLIMGRKTWQSIGRPLPGRETIVVTRDRQFAAPGAVVMATLEDAIEAGHRIARRLSAGEVIVAGGGEIFAQTIGCAAALDLTEVDLAPEGEALFPAIDPAIWYEATRAPQPRSAGDDADFSFVYYLRRPPGQTRG